jgi:hypothetical protein
LREPRFHVIDADVVGQVPEAAVEGELGMIDSDIVVEVVVGEQSLLVVMDVAIFDVQVAGL